MSEWIALYHWASDQGISAEQVKQALVEWLARQKK